MRRNSGLRPLESVVLLVSLAGCPGGDKSAPVDDGSTDDAPVDDAPVDDDSAPTEEDCETAWFTDGDGDGYGAGEAMFACEAPVGASAQDGDCDDADAGVSPGAEEACNLQDDDCDGEVDDGWEVGTVYRDRDEDGYGDLDRSTVGCLEASGWVEDGSDCDDHDDGNHPGADEVCDAEDNDCDGEIDEGWEDPTYTWRDADGDGFGDPGEDARCELAEGWVEDASDCDDGDASVWPGAPEICADMVVNDCDSTWEMAWWDCLDAEVVLGDDAFPIGDTAYMEVALGGDVNGDGLADLLVGTPTEGGFGTWVGAAYLFLGPVTGPLNTADATASLAGEGTKCLMGEEVSLESDLDGDGYTDLLVNAYGYPEADAGSVFVVLGPVTGDLSISDVDGVWLGPDDGGGYVYVGATLSAGTDTDGDGWQDVLAGAQGYPNDTGTIGSVFLFSGAPVGALDLDAAVARLDVEEVSATFEIAVSAHGDVDGDGLFDLLVGTSWAWGHSRPWEPGAAYLVVSPVSGVYDLADADLRVMGNDTWDWAGDRVAMGGDLDGDGLSDLVISAPSEGDEEGSISVFSGTSRGSARMSDGVTRLYGRRGSFLGAALSWQGDRNQDGTTDLLIAAPYINEAWLLPGPTAGSGYLDELAPVHLIGDGVDYGGSGDPSYIFETVSLGGDATGDGQGDLLVGSLEKGAWLVPMFSP